MSAETGGERLSAPAGRIGRHARKRRAATVRPTLQADPVGLHVGAQTKICKRAISIKWTDAELIIAIWLSSRHAFPLDRKLNPYILFMKNLYN